MSKGRADACRGSVIESLLSQREAFIQMNVVSFIIDGTQSLLSYGLLEICGIKSM